MAILKISEVITQPEGLKVPQSSSLTLPLSLATEQASGIGNIGKQLVKIYEDQKEKEDNSTYLDIISKISPELSTIYSAASNETNVLKGAQIFRDTIKEKDFLSQYPDISRNARDKINTWLYKQQIELLPKLSSKITENSIKKTEVTNDNYLTQLNKVGEQLGSVKGVTAMTDVTGFGLLGHLIEMCEGAALSAKISYQSIPKIACALPYLAKQIVPDATYRNWNSYSKHTQFGEGVNVLQAFNLLPDPQTNGGLLISVNENAVEEVMNVLTQYGLIESSIIGKITELQEKLRSKHNICK